MKKFLFFIILLSNPFFIISCNNSSSSTNTGYVDPGDWTGKEISSHKAFTFTNIGESCGPDDSCNAIIYQNELNGVNYVGIGVNDKHDNNDFSLKIYWEASSITTPVTLSAESYTIKIVKSGQEYTSTNSNLNATIIDQNDGTYLITFTEQVSLTNETTTISIETNDSIRAFKYPE